MLHTAAYLVGAAGFILVAVVVALGGRRDAQAWGLAAAALLHGLWAAAHIVPGLPPAALPVLETARALGWAVFFGILLAGGSGAVRPLVVTASAVLLAARLGEVALVPRPAGMLAAQFSLSIDLLAVSIALAMVVAVFRAAGESDRWSLKFLCFPLAMVFGYDLYLLAQSLAVGWLSPEYLYARGLLNAIAAPLAFFAVLRRRYWQDAFEMSRQAALYSVALIAIGGYLLLMGGAAMLLSRVQPGFTPALQVGFLFAAVLLLLFLLSAGRTRAQIKLFLGRHFYARKYDYQHEWRKFMHTLTEQGVSDPLENRIIRACADVLEVPGGALWMLEGGRPRLHATWNHRTAGSVMDGFDPGCFADGDGRLRVLSGDGLAESGLPRIEPNAWCAVPLPHGPDLLGFIVLSRPRAGSGIDAEDEELVLLVARQCASYLAEKRAVSELEENRQFSRFNRQFAFVAHDVKNIISQLSVMLRNFEKHAANPEFQKDMRETVAYSVERMRSLVGRLNSLRQGSDGGEDPRETVALYDLVAREAARCNGDGGPRVRIEAPPGSRALSVRVPEDRFASVLSHLIQNAREAGGPEGTVTVYLDETERDTLIEISDDGPGMSLEFVRESLFAPFRSTKREGFGVGVYQCREFAREHGGDLDVVSSPGSGTTMRLRLPRAGEGAQATRASA